MTKHSVNIFWTSGQPRVAWVLHGGNGNDCKGLESFGNMLFCVATQERRPLGALYCSKSLISCRIFWLRE